MSTIQRTVHSHDGTAVDVDSDGVRTVWECTPPPWGANFIVTKEYWAAEGQGMKPSRHVVKYRLVEVRK